MKRLLRLLVSGAVLGTLVSSCSTTGADVPNFDFPTEATREVGSDKAGSYEDYTLKHTRVRFYSADAPPDLKAWDGFGTDGGFPWELLTGIEIKSRSGDYELPDSLVSDLGNPNIRQSGNNDYVRLQQLASMLRIGMSNSDGAGSYQVLFVIDLQSGKAQRFVRDYLEEEFTRTHDWTPIRIKGEQGVDTNA